jgi:hypothetical protein
MFSHDCVILLIINVVYTGYLSDGDTARSNVTHPLSDVCDGYMSEGGASLCARRLHAQQILLQENR